MSEAVTWNDSIPDAYLLPLKSVVLKSVAVSLHSERHIFNIIEPTWVSLELTFLLLGARICARTRRRRSNICTTGGGPINIDGSI